MTDCLIFGRSGQVGQSIAASLPGFNVTQLGRDQADLSNPQAIADVIKAQRPRVVINAAAYTKVDQAESDEALALAVNGTAPAAMADACRAVGAALIHLSTDYVFAGDADRPYVETDPTAPTGAYGRTKDAGEHAIRAVLPHHIILRTSWVFSATGQNFVKTMLKPGRELVRVVDDQTGNPTPANAIAATVLAMAARILDGTAPDWGTFHYCGQPSTTWHGFAQAIFERAHALSAPVPRLEPIPTSAYPTPVKRPAWSVLDTTKIEQVCGIAPPDWRAELDGVVAAILAPSPPAAG